MNQVKKLKNSDYAVVGVIVAILLIGLTISVLSVIQLAFVPNWMEQREAEHMDLIADQFSQLKYAIDIQSVLGVEDIPVSVPITLGSDDIPYFNSEKSYGYLDLIPNYVNISFENDTFSSYYLIGIVKYSSSNAYFLDQSYIYESGAIIKGQSGSNIMTVKPNLKTRIAGTNVTDINLTIVNIRGVGEKLSASGYGNYPIRIEFLSSSDITIYGVNFINLTSANYKSWHLLINNTLNNSGLVYGAGYTITTSEIDKNISVEIKDEQTVNVFLKDIEINAQIAPGWVEES
jgi:hypothetical protein